MRGSMRVGAAQFQTGGKNILFDRPVEVLTAHRTAEVRPALARLEAAVSDGRYAAGYLAYEAAGAFDAALLTYPAGDLPLLWFGLYDRMAESADRADEKDYNVGRWDPMLSEDAYLAAIRRIRDHIAAGDTYQVNFTFPLRADFQGDSGSWFRRLCRAQGNAYGAHIDTGRFAILSISPELFFSLEGDHLTTRPMKGTRPRGRWRAEDEAMAAALRASEKERAENVMIVDLLRNDMGRISRTGTVRVASLFDLERYETVWQMTSTISSHTDDGLADVFAALFPSGSVTGAPKIETMKIIRKLEPFPRGVYCGAVGWCGPGRRACFNVAIRTVTIDHMRGEARYSVGSGITWDSSATAEFQECYDKAALLTFQRPPFELLESLLYDGSYFLFEEHVQRLMDSVAYFGISADVNAIRAALLDRARDFPAEPLKVRLLVSSDGFRIETTPMVKTGRVRLGFARQPVDSRDVFLFHKTTHRRIYDAAKASRPDCDDVLLWNERGEITESTIANVVAEVGGKLLTPPLACGLLGGTFREDLLRRGQIREGILTREDIRGARKLCLINSVRKWIDVDLVD